MSRSGLATFHSQTVPSPLPAARVCPSGLNATEVTPSLGPARVCPFSVAWEALLTFHSQILAGPPPAFQVVPAARVCPSGLNATEVTPVVGPVRGRPIWVAWAALLTFHSWTVRPSATARV